MLIEVTMPDKRKNRPDHACFLTQRPIERCVQRLKGLHTHNFRVDIVHHTSDQVNFLIRLYEHGRIRVTGKGTLRRWEGTLTRVDCTMHEHDGTLTWLLLMVIFLGLFLLVIPFLILKLFGINPGMVLIFAAALAIGIMIWLRFIDRFAPADDVPPNIVTIVEDALR